MSTCTVSSTGTYYSPSRQPLRSRTPSYSQSSNGSPQLKYRLRLIDVDFIKIYLNYAKHHNLPGAIDSRYTHMFVEDCHKRRYEHHHVSHAVLLYYTPESPAIKNKQPGLHHSKTTIGGESIPQSIMKQLYSHIDDEKQVPNQDLIADMLSAKLDRFSTPSAKSITKLKSHEEVCSAWEKYGSSCQDIPSKKYCRGFILMHSDTIALVVIGTDSFQRENKKVYQYTILRDNYACGSIEDIKEIYSKILQL
jgi:hypothetical protein